MFYAETCRGTEGRSAALRFISWREVGPGEWKVEVNDFPPFKHFTFSTEQEKVDRFVALPQKDMWLQFGAVPFAPIMKQFASLLGIEYVKDKECRELHQVYGEFVEVKREFVVDFPRRIWYNNKCRETSRAALF